MLVYGSYFPDTRVAPRPTKAELVLTAEERGVLERFTNRRKTAQALALRAGIVLACAEKAQPSNQAVAQRLG